MTESEILRLKRERDALYRQLERTPRAESGPLLDRLDRIHTILSLT